MAKVGQSGVLLFSNHVQDGDELLKLADMAMYQAKQEGRDRICFNAKDTTGSAAPLL